MSSKSSKVLISTLLIWAATIATAGADQGSIGVQPGTVDDPVITKSYLEQNIKQYISEASSTQSITEEKVKELITTELSKNQTGTSPSSPNTQSEVNSNNISGTSLTVLKLEPGQSLFGGPGTELIVRTGKVLVTSSDENGIPDVTSGKDIAAGSTVELNHLLIIPRDGRGIKSDPKLKQDIFVMVRGSYLLTNADGSKATP
ncbi:MAG: hypothetical protein K0S39_718 [Paenibacillus sp.]|jgi:hypothetical protein|nr:hypothetical protein [Paenibacillus sp.]